LTRARVEWIIPDVRWGARFTAWFADAAGMIFFSALAVAAIVGGALAAVWIGRH
jgi:hypothetical protein